MISDLCKVSTLGRSKNWSKTNCERSKWWSGTLFWSWHWAGRFSQTPLDWLGSLAPELWAISLENSWKLIFPSPSRSASAIIDLTSAPVSSSPRLFMVSLSFSSEISPSPSLSNTLKACATSFSMQAPPLDHHVNKLIKINGTIRISVHILDHITEIFFSWVKSMGPHDLKKSNWNLYFWEYLYFYCSKKPY